MSAASPDGPTSYSFSRTTIAIWREVSPSYKMAASQLTSLLAFSAAKRALDMGHLLKRLWNETETYFEK